MSKVPDIQWLRERLGRGYKDAQWNWVSHLYNAYRHTDDMKYLTGMTEMFLHWYETVRPPAGVPRIWLSPSFINNPWDSHQTSRKVHTLALPEARGVYACQVHRQHRLG